jgi:hypothetical protein
MELKVYPRRTSELGLEQLLRRAVVEIIIFPNEYPG